MKRKKHIARLIGLLLSAALVLTCVPQEIFSMAAYAAEVSEESDDDDPAADDTLGTDAVVVSEDTSSEDASDETSSDSDDSSSGTEDSSGETDTDDASGSDDTSSDTDGTSDDETEDESDGETEDTDTEEEEEEEAADLSDGVLTLGYTSTVYTGSARTPSVTVTLSDGTVLTKNTDYTAAYASNTDIGSACVTVTGIGNYTGTLTKTFTIIPAAPTISSASWTDTRALTVKWSAVSGSVTGYQVQYRTKGSSSWKTKTVTSAVSCVLSSLSVSGQYEIRIRAYKTVSGTNYYGSYSSVTTVKSRYQRTIKVNGTKTVLHHTAGTWTKKNGYKYYTISSTGKKAKSTFLNIKGSVYYFDSKGRMYTSWHKIKGSYYFFSRTTGKMQSGKTVDKVKIGSYGTASTKSIYVKRIKVMIAAREMMEENTKASDSKSAKLKKCFKALFPYPYKQYRKLSKIYKEANWELTFANDIFVRGKGCCVSLASAFAYLARECGYTDVYIAHDTGHAWTMVNGYVYDPLFAEAKGWSGNYKGNKKGDYRTNPPYKRSI